MDETLVVHSWYLHLFSANLHEMVTLGGVLNKGVMSERRHAEQTLKSVCPISALGVRQGRKRRIKTYMLQKYMSTLSYGTLYALITSCGQKQRYVSLSVSFI